MVFKTNFVDGNLQVSFIKLQIPVPNFLTNEGPRSADYYHYYENKLQWLFAEMKHANRERIKRLGQQTVGEYVPTMQRYLHLLPWSET